MRVLTILFLVALTLISCRSSHVTTLAPPKEPEIVVDKPTSMCGWAHLADAQLLALEDKAKAGDAEAAFRISLHYQTSGDPIKGNYWALYAARLGHPVAQYNLWFFLRQSQVCQDQLDAVYWLKKAAAQGYPGAIKKLDSIEQHPDCKVNVTRSRMPSNNSFKPNSNRCAL